ncbi:MAG: hypothetical protein ACM3UX_00210 [Candidatus Woesearchaeota archaeon]
MKLKYLGGKTEQVNQKQGQKWVRVEKDQLTQMFEAVEYHWPKPGSVLSVAPAIGHWLLGKCSKWLVEVAEEPNDLPTVHNRIVAVMPDEVKVEKKAEPTASQK